MSRSAFWPEARRGIRGYGWASLAIAPWAALYAAAPLFVGEVPGWAKVVLVACAVLSGDVALRLLEKREPKPVVAESYVMLTLWAEVGHFQIGAPTFVVFQLEGSTGHAWAEVPPQTTRPAFGSFSRPLLVNG
jgi:hypothetical protein